jgi:hypothetical protein
MGVAMLKARLEERAMNQPSQTLPVLKPAEA